MVHNSSQYSDLEIILIADIIISASVQAVLQQTLHKHLCHLHTAGIIALHWLSQIFIYHNSMPLSWKLPTNTLYYSRNTT